jgi:hypothetical protein
MVLIGLSPRPASLWGRVVHRILCDARKMGFRPLRDNQVLRHRIVAEIAGDNVTAVIDTPVALLCGAHPLIGPSQEAGSRGQNEAPGVTWGQVEEETLRQAKAGELAGLSAFHFFAFGALLAACLVEVLANRREQPWVAARLGAVLRLLGLNLPVLGIG